MKTLTDAELSALESADPALAAHYRAAAIEKTNPVVAARYRLANDVKRPADVTTPDPRDGAARFAALRGETPTTEPDELRARYLEIKKTNPAVAARFALANGVHDKATK